MVHCRSRLQKPNLCGFADKSAVDLCPGAVLIVDSLVTNSRRGSILHPFILNMVPRADYPVLQFSCGDFEIVPFLGEAKPVDWLISRGAKGLNGFSQG